MPSPEILPKVLVVDLSIRYGGSTSRILSLMHKALPGNIGLAAVESSAISKEAKNLNIPIHFVGKHRLDYHIIKNLREIIKSENYQVIDTQNIQSKVWASLALKKVDAALVSTLNSWYAKEHGKVSLKGLIYTFLELHTNASLDLYITVSANDRNSVLRANIPTEKIELIYNAVHNYDEIINSKDWLIKKFSLPENHIICTAVGRLVAIKGHDVLIKAAEFVAQKNKKIQVLIIGEGKNRYVLEKQIQKLGIQNIVTLGGYQDREVVLSIVKASDIFVMPSRYEGTPIALLEAASLGTPIIASNAGGIPELVSNETHALLVTPNDTEALSQAILRLAEDNNLRKKISASAMTRVQQEFSLEKQFTQTWQAYQKAFVLHQNKKQSEG